MAQAILVLCSTNHSTQESNLAIIQIHWAIAADIEFVDKKTHDQTKCHEILLSVCWNIIQKTKATNTSDFAHITSNLMVKIETSLCFFSLTTLCASFEMQSSQARQPLPTFVYWTIFQQKLQDLNWCFVWWWSFVWLALQLSSEFSQDYDPVWFLCALCINQAIQHF